MGGGHISSVPLSELFMATAPACFGAPPNGMS